VILTRRYKSVTMGGYYDEIEIEDMTWDAEAGVYHYPCPCGDRFEISRKQLAECEDIATCPSCSLVIRVIYDPLDFEDDLEEDEEDESSSAGESEEPKEPAEDDAVTPVPTGLENAIQSLKIKGNGNTDQEASDGGRIFGTSSGIGVQDGGNESRVGVTLVVDGTAYGKTGIIPKGVDT